MRILLTGASGQLGTELQKTFSGGDEIIATDIVVPKNADPGFRVLDLGDESEVAMILDEVKPQVIINAAAYTQVDLAESDRELATRINAGAPGDLARWAADNDAFLMHYSTDYVFDGRSSRPYKESDRTSPINFYGESKLAGERAVTDSGCQHVILRTSWIYSSQGKNFLRTMVKLGQERSHLSVVNDQFGCPTWAKNLARVSMLVINKITEARNASSTSSAPNGLYHYCDTPACTWYDFAQQIFGAATAQGMMQNKPEVEAVRSDQFPTAARRPRYSVLDTSKIQKDLRIEPAKVHESVWACLEEGINQNE